MSAHPVDLLGAHALGALDADEQASVEEHLRHCADCRAEVDAYRVALAVAADAVPQVAPPAALRDRLLRRIGEGPTASASSSTIVSAGPEAPPPPASVGRSGAARGIGPGRDRGGRWRVVAVAAGIATLVAVGAWLQARGRASEYADRLARMEDEAQDLRAEATARAHVVARQDSLLEVVLGPGSAAAFLASERLPTARVFFSADRARVLLSVADLPPAPDGRTYQLWGIPEGGAPVSLGTFDTAPDGTVVVLLDGPPDGDYALSAVTEEPLGGSPQPTTTPFLAGAVATETTPF